MANTNKVKYGLKNVYYALYDEDADTYSTPVAILARSTSPLRRKATPMFSERTTQITLYPSPTTVTAATSKPPVSWTAS